MTDEKVTMRVVVCEACGGDRGHDVVSGYYPWGTTGRWVPCTACDATGEIEVEVEPIDLDDLAAISKGPTP
jgi:hypothetical protein